MSAYADTCERDRNRARRSRPDRQRRRPRFDVDAFEHAQQPQRHGGDERPEEAGQPQECVIAREPPNRDATCERGSQPHAGEHRQEE